MTTTSALPSLDRTARVLTEILAPWVLVAGLPLAVALAHAPRPERLGWSLVTIVACSMVPMAAIKRAQHAGVVTSGHHVTERAERIAPLLLAVGSVVGGLVALHAGHAPRDLTVLTWAMFAGLVSALAVTVWWKISFHVAVAAAAVVILADVYGLWLYAAGLPAAAVAWSRVRLAEHTAAQVVAGAALGVTVSGLLFLGLA